MCTFTPKGRNKSTLEQLELFLNKYKTTILHCLQNVILCYNFEQLFISTVVGSKQNRLMNNECNDCVIIFNENY